MSQLQVIELGDDTVVRCSDCGIEHHYKISELSEDSRCAVALYLAKEDHKCKPAYNVTHPTYGNSDKETYAP